MASEPPTRPTAAARLKLRKPFCGLSHLTGAALGVAALVGFVSMARGKPGHISTYSIHGATLILFYLASALCHSLPVSERHLFVLGGSACQVVVMLRFVVPLP
jgi:predicted membrane channel-forming protein YqfA (hemolysin III family)